MTALAPPEVVPDRPVPRTGGVRRWWRSWRTSLRIARRDSWQHKGQSLLVVLVILAPVAVLTTFDVYLRTEAFRSGPQGQALAQLGTVADARIVDSFAGPVAQSAYGMGGPIADFDLVIGDPSAHWTPHKGPTLPTAWHTVEVQQEDVKVPDTGTWLTVTAGNTRDPLVAGTFRLLDGRLPDKAGEISIDRHAAAELGAKIGDPLTLTVHDRKNHATPQRTFTVVGIASGAGKGSSLGSALVLPGQLPWARPTTTWLATTPAPLSWSDVRALNQDGLVVVSRAVVENPPDFCAPTDFCGDDGPIKSVDGFDGPSSITPDAVAFGVLVAMLALIQVALMAGPAFAVSLRRRQRDLALVAANGGTPSDLRRSVLATAVVLGLVAAVAAVVAGWAVVRLAYSALAGQNDYLLVPSPVLGLEILPLALVAVLAAVTAAWVPARIAGRTDVLHALRGRRPAAALRGRSAAVGGGLLATGIVLLVLGATASEGGVGMALGIIAYQIGILLLIPWVIRATAAAGRRLPLSLRLATRDSTRHRLRTVSAVCAVSAAAVGASVTLLFTSSSITANAANYVPEAQPGVVLADAYYSGDNAPRPQQVVRYVEAVREAFTAAAPGSLLGWAQKVTAGDNDKTYSTVVLRPPDCRPTTESGFPIGGEQTDCSHIPGSQHFGVQQADPVWLRAIVGESSKAWDAAVADGQAITFDRAAMHNDSVELALVRDSETSATIISSARLPAVPVDSASIRALVLVAVDRRLPPGWHSDGTIQFAAIPGDGADSSAVATALQRAIVSAGGPLGWDAAGDPPYVERGFQDDHLPFILILVGGTAFLALFAALSVTALSLVDARRDLATMAAVGAPPRSRRGYAAGTALVVAGPGCVIGVIAGLVPGWAVARGMPKQIIGPDGAFDTVPISDYFTVPWLALLTLVVAIPLVTTGVAWLFTRSRIPLTRRAE